MFCKSCWSVLILLAGMFFVVGCGKSKIPGCVPGEGVVYYDDKPLAWAVVIFTPETNTPGARAATGQTDERGSFTLNTLGEKGILPNDYLVTVRKDIKKEDAQSVEKWKKKHAEGGNEPPPSEGLYDVVSVVPKKYTVSRESGIEVNIPQKGSRDIKIEIQTSP